MSRVQQVFSLENAGQSYASERKRVRLALLRAHPQFLEDLKSLGQTVRSYRIGFDSKTQFDFENKWNVSVEVAASSQIENAQPTKGNFELSYRENLSFSVNDPLSAIESDEPIYLLWDAKYFEAVKCSGEPDLKMIGDDYVAIPMGISLNEAIAMLKTAGVGEHKGYLINTDEAGLKESIQVLRCSLGLQMKVPDIVRHLHPNLNSETFKSKSTRYTTLLKQMMAIIESRPPASQQN
jgi:hypothetical protein